MTYASVLRRLHRRGFFVIKPGLDRIGAILTYLGEPQDKVPCIHIAGTNGKGSVAASLESILRHAGYRTGLYTSPHLVEVRERIQIQRKMISTSRFRSVAERVFSAEAQLGLKLTYFEFTTAVAFLTFAEEPVDIAVVEVGMGGRWDATNTIKRPLLSCITSIGLDHTQWLGKTEATIAREKAGIIKPGVPVVSGVRGNPGLVIAKAAHRIGSPLWQIGKQFKAHAETAMWTKASQRIRYTGLTGTTRTMALHLLGKHQVDNGALALACSEALQQSGWKIAQKAIEKGLSNVSWPGRLQPVLGPRGIQILFDGAHNPPAIHRLIETLKDSPWAVSPKTFVFSVFRDKDYRSMISSLLPLAKNIIVCTMAGSRALPAQELLRYGASSSAAVRLSRNPQEAYRLALRITDPKDVIIVTGSLHLVGELLPKKQTISVQPLKQSAKRHHNIHA